MIPDENHTIEMDWLRIMNVINEINGNMTLIWLNAREIKDESMSDKQVENLDHIMDGEHRAYWMLKDLPGIFPSINKHIPNPPDFTTTRLADAEEELVGGYRHLDLGNQLLQDAPDFLDLTLCYRDLFRVVYIMTRLLFLLEKLKDRGSEITFNSFTEKKLDNQFIRIQIDCCNEGVLYLDEGLLYRIPLPYQDLRYGGRYISGLEFAMAKQCLLSMGGDFFAEKVDDHLNLELVLPTFQIANGSAADE